MEPTRLAGGAPDLAQAAAHGEAALEAVLRVIDAAVDGEDDPLAEVTRRVRASAVELHAAMSELRALAGLPERRDLLTPRQGEVCALVARGLTNFQIANRLGLSERTVRKHLEDAFARTGCTSRTALALWWRSARRVADPPLSERAITSAS